jgi:hypothetical protein
MQVGGKRMAAARACKHDSDTAGKGVAAIATRRAIRTTRISLAAYLFRPLPLSADSSL